MIRSLLIANRGEIACRIIRTARALGVRTVAVYSDADAKALHVRMADEAVHIGPSPARESYLCGDKIIQAAKATGAEAIHPGYGFLSENADFAQAVIDAGLIWVGPKADSIRAMGLKDAAKTLMAKAGVPVTPGYIGDDQSPEWLQQEAEAIGYPVLIKAVAGGGGKGMRRVDRAEDFDDALDSCKREAASSFGNDIVLIEKYILSPRHIEVQVFGDSHGNVVHLFERDCSLQRRHQKVIEEAPAPGMDEATREAVCSAAVRAAKAVHYEGAGTIEFIADASEGLRADRIWFMEMNTRLQVEHPVTEEITGQDLVEWQLRVASGELLPKRQDELSITGHAIEARIYAEDPRNNFLPSIGTFEFMKFMSSSEYDDMFASRLDFGYEECDAVSPFYDPMIGKLIKRHANREEAARLLAEHCGAIQIWPVRTNLRFVVRALGHPDFIAGRIDTGFIERHLEALAMAPMPVEDMAAEAALELYSQAEVANIPRHLEGFRLNATPQVTARVIDEFGAIYPVSLLEESPAFPALHWDPYVSFFEGETRTFSRYEPRGIGVGPASDGMILAPMPGRVTAVEVAAGDSVVKGQRLLTLEAMKMEHGLIAPFDGVVAELNAVEGAQAQVDALLVRIEAAVER